MDPLTHALLGAATAYVIGGRKLGRHAAAVGALAGIAPDVDNFISSKEDPLLYVEYHRFFTHSLAFAVFGSLLAALPWIARPRFRAQWMTLWLCSFPAYLSHCLLDASTTYGTQLFWPFSRARVGWDLVAVVDPIVTVGLTVALVVALRRQNVRVAAGGLAFVLGYLALGGLQNARARNAQAILAEHRGHVRERIEIMPTLGNNLVWRSLYLVDGRIYSDRIRVGWFSAPTCREGTSLPLVTHELLNPLERQANRATRVFDRFAWFSDGWVARSPFDELIIGDMRYSISTKAFDPIWGIRVTEEGDRTRAEWVNRQLERKVALGELWAEIAGRHPEYKPVSQRAPARSDD